LDSFSAIFFTETEESLLLLLRPLASSCTLLLLLAWEHFSAAGGGGVTGRGGGGVTGRGGGGGGGGIPAPASSYLGMIWLLTSIENGDSTSLITGSGGGEGGILFRSKEEGSTDIGVRGEVVDTDSAGEDFFTPGSTKLFLILSLSCLVIVTTSLVTVFSTLFIGGESSCILDG